MSARPVSARTLSHRLTAGMALVALMLALPLEGCGKKPGHLDPPEGAGPDAARFPRAYPNDRYDPVPVGAKAPAAPPVPEPMVPAQTYPPVIRPDSIVPNAPISSPGQATTPGSANGWLGSTTRGQ